MTLLQRFAKFLMPAAMALTLFVGPAALAQVNVNEQFNQTLQSSGLVGPGQRRADITSSLGQAVNVFIGLIGIATFALVVYAGALWILAAGNEDKVEQAKGILKGAVLGLIIIFSAYVIVNFTLTQLQEALGSN